MNVWKNGAGDEVLDETSVGEADGSRPGLGLGVPLPPRNLFYSLDKVRVVSKADVIQSISRFDSHLASCEKPAPEGAGSAHTYAWGLGWRLVIIRSMAAMNAR